MENKKEIFKELITYTILIVAIILIKTFLVAPIRVNGTSMIDTLENGDIMILNKIGYRFSDIKRFDIVVVDDKEELIIKRIIGLPGERIEYKDNKLYVDGKYIKEDFPRKEMDDYSIEELNETEVPEDTYFVLGDNRPNSKDSRIIGFVPRKQILGKTSLTIFPFSRFGNKK